MSNDLDAAAAALQGDAAKRNAVAAWKQSQVQGILQKQGQTAASEQAYAKGKSVKDLQSRRDFLVQEVARLNTLIQQGYQDESRENFDRVALRRITSKSELTTQRPKLQAQLASAQQELRDVYAELSNTPR